MMQINIPCYWGEIKEMYACKYSINWVRVKLSDTWQRQMAVVLPMGKVHPKQTQHGPPKAANITANQELIRAGYAPFLSVFNGKRCLIKASSFWHVITGNLLQAASFARHAKRIAAASLHSSKWDYLSRSSSPSSLKRPTSDNKYICTRPWLILILN